MPGLTPDQLAKADTNQLLIAVLLTSIPTLLGLLALVIRYATESRKRKEEMTKIKFEAETSVAKLREETEINIDKAREEAEQKQKSAQLGVVSQLADQVQTVLTSNDRTMRLLEQQVAQVSELVHQKEVLIGVVDKQQETAKIRNAVQLEQYSRIEEAQRNILSTLQVSFDKLLKDINHDFMNWMEGLRADGEFQSALLALRDMPNRMDKTDRALSEITNKVNDLPRDVSLELKQELELLSKHIESVVLRLQEVQNNDGQSLADPGSKTLSEAVTQPTFHSAGTDSFGILRHPADQPE